RLDKSISADVAVIGAGVTGITTAFLLARAGRKVVVLEAGKTGMGSTAMSTGNLYCLTGSTLNALLSRYTPEEVIRLTEARRQAIQLMERLVEENSLDCDFQRQAWNLFSLHPEQDRAIDKELALARA